MMTMDFKGLKAVTKFYSFGVYLSKLTANDVVQSKVDNTVTPKRRCKIEHGHLAPART